MFDFNMEYPIVIEEYEFSDYLFYFNTTIKKRIPKQQSSVKPLFFNKTPVPFSIYEKSFNLIQNHLKKGNSYLVNLTFPASVETNCSLFDIFCAADSKYKLLWKDEFCVFSPETFVQIKNRKIFSYPMKGTIDAAIPDAEKIILSDIKEMEEHNTIVDLIRNDLSYHTRNVHVSKFRYIDTIKTNSKTLLQVSSEITGDLQENYREHLGTILFSMLPAGSISGAPKKKTVEIIQEAEIYDRGYYTGICGYFDGTDLDSFVMIRFIEKNRNKLIYKSGGGITLKSNAEDEYREMIDKIYLPV